MELQFIEKLNALNYKYWAIMARTYLEKEELWDVIERKDPASNVCIIHIHIHTYIY